jgi:O-antigen/teichoic acid export membrane protein
MYSLFERLKESLLARNTFAMLTGGGIRLLVQGIYFVLIARALGVEQYGAFVGVVALVAILAPFASFGTGSILIRNVARDRETFGHSWGNALWMTTASGSVLLAFVLLLARYVLAGKVPLSLVLLVGSSDLILAALVGLSSQAFQAVEELHRTAQVNVVLVTSRAIAAVGLIVLIAHPTAFSWGFFYCFSSGVAATYSVAKVCRKLGFPRLSLKQLRSDLLEGFYFSISISSASIYNDIDKTMLVRLGTFGATGIYAAAYRIIDLAFQPVAALSASAYANFFKHGRRGVRGTLGFAKRLIPFAVSYAVLAIFVLFFAARALPLFLGHGFAESVEALRWLSPILLFRTIHYFLSSSLTGADLQAFRSGIQVAVAVLNVMLNLWLIPAFSWRGAAGASIACDGLLAIAMFVAVLLFSRRQDSAEAGCSAQPRLTS